MRIIRERYYNRGCREYILCCYVEHNKAKAVLAYVAESAMSIRYEESVYQMLEEKLKDMR